MYLYQGTKLLCTVLLVAAFFSCQKKMNNVESKVEMVRADSVLFTFANNDVEAVLKRESGNIGGQSSGPTLWQRSGSLSFILSDFYEKPLDFINNPYFRNSYDLKVTWSEAVSFEKVRTWVDEKLQNELNYTVESEMRQEQAFQIIINDGSLLDSNEPVGDGTISKRSIQNSQWEYYGSLDGLAELITEQTGRKVLITESENFQEAYYFQLNAVGGFKGIAQQLEGNYGIVFDEVSVPVEYYVINFD